MIKKQRIKFSPSVLSCCHTSMLLNYRVLLLTCSLVLMLPLLTACSQPVANKTVHKLTTNNHTWSVELALTPSQQEQGLSYRQQLATSTGMLFIFDRPAIQVFWMKDMGFALDIIWLKEQKIVKIDEHLPPEGSQPLNQYSSLEPIDQVLEINAGEASLYGLKVGDKVNYE